MRKFFVKLSVMFFNFIYKKQNDIHKKRMIELKKKVLSSNVSGEKKYITSSAMLDINASSKKAKKINQEKVEKLVQTYLHEPKKLFDYIKGANTKVYVLKSAKKILSVISEDEGFILPKKGIKALYLNLILNKKFSLTTSEMFVMSSYDVNIYAFIYQFYNWYCYKMKLYGFEDNIQENFKHIFEICETSKVNTLSYDEIMGLKAAIRHDIEAIEFVKNMAVKNSMAKKNLNKIKSGKKVNI